MSPQKFVEYEHNALKGINARKTARVAGKAYDEAMRSAERTKTKEEKEHEKAKAKSTIRRRHRGLRFPWARGNDGEDGTPDETTEEIPSKETGDQAV